MMIRGRRRQWKTVKKRGIFNFGVPRVPRVSKVLKVDK